MFIINTSLISSKIDNNYASQSEFADKLGITASKLSRFLNSNNKNVDLDLLYRISVLLKLSISEIIIKDEDDIKIQREKDIVSEMETDIEKLYIKIKSLKDKITNDSIIVKDENADYLIFNKEQVYTFEFKSKTIPQTRVCNIKNKLYKWNLYPYYQDTLDDYLKVAEEPEKKYNED